MGVLDIEFDATYINGGRHNECRLLIDNAGIGMRFGIKVGGYSWGQIRRVSFDDPGRTKASVGAIAAFGVLGLAHRRAFSLITVSTDTEELYFEHAQPIGVWRATGRRITEDFPAAAGRVYVDGQRMDESTALPIGPSNPGWYPDPLGLPSLRWHDGSAWTEHTAPVPQRPQ